MKVADLTFVPQGTPGLDMNAFDCGRAGNAVSQLGHRKRWSVGDTTHVPRYDITEKAFT